MSATLPPSAQREEERLSETQERFLRSAAERLPLERVVELHLFPPLRQGGVETGFAVIAARRPASEPAPESAPEAPPAAPVEGEGGETAQALDERSAGEGEPASADRSETPPAPPADAPADAPATDERLVVFTARYRWTFKGPDRGKWEVGVVEEADAPLVTVDAVVRGVQRRIGEGAEPERLTAEQLHALLDRAAGATTGG